MVSLSNDKKRKEFLEDHKNWEPLPSADNFVRISKLLYKEHMWLHLELWQTVTRWDKDQHRLVEETGWQNMGYCTINGSTHALNEWVMGLKAIATQIKEIDKKEKQK